MKYQSYLIIEGIDLPLPNTYDLEFRDIEADTGGVSSQINKRYFL